MDYTLEKWITGGRHFSALKNRERSGRNHWRLRIFTFWRWPNWMIFGGIRMGISEHIGFQFRKMPALDQLQHRDFIRRAISLLVKSASAWWLSHVFQGSWPEKDLFRIVTAKFESQGERNKIHRSKTTYTDFQAYRRERHDMTQTKSFPACGATSLPPRRRR